jgi:hypothetical protein
MRSGGEGCSRVRFFSFRARFFFSFGSPSFRLLSVASDVAKLARLRDDEFGFEASRLVYQLSRGISAFVGWPHGGTNDEPKGFIRRMIGGRGREPRPPIERLRRVPDRSAPESKAGL